MNPNFNKQDSARLNHLSLKLTRAENERDEVIEAYDKHFAEVFEIFDGEIGRDKPARFICNDGYKLARLVPDIQPKVNLEILEQVIKATFTPEMASKMWNRITVVKREVNQDKLAMEILSNPVLGEAIANSGAVIKPTRRPSRIHRELSKKEKMLVQAGQELPDDEAVSA